MARSALAGLCSLVTTACSLVETEGLSSGGPPSTTGDASQETGGDAGTSLPGSNGDGGVRDSSAEESNLLTNGDFELGCAGWDVAFGSISQSSESHGRREVLQVLHGQELRGVSHADRDRPGQGRRRVLRRDLDPRRKLAVRARERRAPGLRPQARDGEGPRQGPSGPPTTAEWALATTLFTTSADAESIAISFRLQQQGNPASVGNVICVYVDDAVIRRIK